MTITITTELLTAGVDEAGRGPLAGPVMAAAVILDPTRPIDGLADSKKISERRRDALEAEIKDKALAWAVASADVVEIDTLNILHATMLAMRRAVAALEPVPLLALIDGDRCPSPLACRAEAIIKGDQTVPAISAASILAKVARDRELLRMEEQYPGYGFAKHKGYPTKDHVAALERLGVTPVHRCSFGPVRRML
ncbi:MAG: ribonuclease HII [Gammaproteobacteria bacterium]|jgi:ribonuclease HII